MAGFKDASRSPPAPAILSAGGGSRNVLDPLAVLTICCHLSAQKAETSLSLVMYPSLVTYKSQVTYLSLVKYLSIVTYLSPVTYLSLGSI